MKKHIKLIVFIISLAIVFITYNSFRSKNEQIIYLSLGDSIAEGMTPYHDIDYGYTDYISDYIKKNKGLSFYTKKYSKSGYTIGDLVNDINNNKVIEEDGEKVYLKEIMRESDIVTLTIGANDFIKGLSLDDIPKKLLDIEGIKKEADEITNSLKDLIILIKQYAKNQIIVTGYFNPLPRLTSYKNDIDEIVKYFNNEVEEICEELKVDYVDIFTVLDGNSDAFSNPLDIHPNKMGYELISKEIIKVIK